MWPSRLTPTRVAGVVICIVAAPCLNCLHYSRADGAVQAGVVGFSPNTVQFGVWRARFPRAEALPYRERQRAGPRRNSARSRGKLKVRLANARGKEMPRSRLDR